jgi:DnaJ-class molecular chaperone
MTDAPHQDLCDALERWAASWSAPPDFVTCGACGGSGEIWFNRSRNREPWNDESYPCRRCGGDGVIQTPAVGTPPVGGRCVGSPAARPSASSGLPAPPAAGMTTTAKP